LLTIETKTPSATMTPPNVPRTKELVDLVFPNLFSDANQELANLVLELCQTSQASRLHATDNRSASKLLMKAVRYAAKQYMLQAELGSLALLDDLTGLYNRRAFRALAERQLKLARRSGYGMLLFFLDVDGLKQINDSFGHFEGDHALTVIADALRRTFRDSDIVARLGGDEFAVLAIEAPGRSEAIIRGRLRKHLETINAEGALFAISLSVGVARFDRGNPSSIEDLMAQADRAMYEQKRSRAAAQNSGRIAPV
jgi:diguanylate cyclase (GGDEF)-like protein